MATGFDDETQKYIEAELKQVKTKILENIKGVEIISLHIMNVQVSLKYVFIFILIPYVSSRQILDF
jgi:hypothetical protein